MMDFLTKYEKETGFVARTSKKLPDFDSEDAFREYVGEHSEDFRQVMVDMRVAFLEANGYTITRKTLIDSGLSDQITPEPDPSETLVEELKSLDQSGLGDQLPPPPPAK